MIYWKNIAAVGFPAEEVTVLVVWQGQAHKAMLCGDLAAPDVNDTLYWSISTSEGTKNVHTVEVDWYSEINLPR